VRAGGSYPGLDALDRFLDWLLGPRCERCLGRVFPADEGRHSMDCS
jgi:hypothetical protein